MSITQGDNIAVNATQILGDMSQLSVLNNVNGSLTSTTAAYKNSTTTAWMAYSFSEAKNFYRFKVFGTTDVGYVGGSTPRVTITFGGKNGSAPIHMNDYDKQLCAVGFTDPNDNTAYEAFNNFMDEAFEHIVCKIELYNGSGKICLSEVEAFEALVPSELPEPLPLASRNYIDNGNFAIKPKGSSITGLNVLGTTLDGRWFVSREGGNTYATYMAGADGVEDSALKIHRYSGDTSVKPLNLTYRFDPKTIQQMRGKLVTIGALVKVGTDFSALPDLISISGYMTSTNARSANRHNDSVIGVDTNSNARWINVEKAAPSSSVWEPIWLTFKLPTNINGFDLRFRYYPSGTAGANDWLAISQVMAFDGIIRPFFVHENPADTAKKVARFYQTTYENNIAPGTNTERGLELKVDRAVQNDKTYSISYNFNDGEMDVAPWLKVYSREGNINKCNFNALTGNSVTLDIFGVSSKGFFGYINDNAWGLGVHNAVSVACHYVADAGIYGNQ